jgi:hypothetical protein
MEPEEALEPLDPRIQVLNVAEGKTLAEEVANYDIDWSVKRSVTS